MIQCREILRTDHEQIVELLTRGFARNKTYWSNAMLLLTHHPTPLGYPKFGYLLEDSGTIVGVLLLIYTEVGPGNQKKIRCNLSSWYVDTDYRGMAAFLSMQATKRKGVSYFNVSPAPHTWATLEATGFKRFATGRVIAIPALTGSPAGATVSGVAPDTPSGPDLAQWEINLLADHAAYGCKSLLCEVAGTRHPFVFGVRRRYGLIPMAHLLFARSLDDFVQLAGPLGRHLITQGYPCVVVDADAPIPALVGKFSPNRPRFYKGPPLALGDLAYSEQAIFGY